MIIRLSCKDVYFTTHVYFNCLIQIMNMYGDLVMDSVPDKVKTLCRTFWRHFHACCVSGGTDVYVYIEAYV